MTRAILVAVFVLGSASEVWAQDIDADGIPDATDNCVESRNPLQLDPDIDGYGNSCDADFDQDGDVDNDDFTFFNGCALAVCDLCEDGNTPGFCDFAAFSSAVGMPPGPSGYACAGTVPCPGESPPVPALNEGAWFGLVLILASLAGAILLRRAPNQISG